MTLAIAKKVAPVLARLPEQMMITGHTDSSPYNGPGRTNWELSADRANAARRVMQQNGVGLRQISQVRGYADQRLRKPKNPDDASNRRISLVVQYLTKPDEDDKPPANKNGVAVPKVAPKEVPKKVK